MQWRKQLKLTCPEAGFNQSFYFCLEILPAKNPRDNFVFDLKIAESDV